MAIKCTGHYKKYQKWLEKNENVKFNRILIVMYKDLYYLSIREYKIMTYFNIWTKHNFLIFLHLTKLPIN